MSNPFRIDAPAVISFSGGRTSGLMLYRILDAFGGTLPDDIKVVFCNTGKERPETLDFVERCSAEWGVPITWLEYRYETQIPCPTRAEDWRQLDDEPFGERTQRWDAWYRAIHPDRLAKEQQVAVRKAMTRQQRKAIPAVSKTVGRHSFSVVNYASASRRGEPLEEVIAARNMLPNVMSRFCTVECKIRTTCRFLLSLGWTQWGNAIGFRADEPQRVAKLAGTNRHSREETVTPLADEKVTNADVLSFWAANSFDLQLESHEGNCDLCFLKGIGKTKRIMATDPQYAAWWIRMEAAADRRGLARNKSVAFFRKDRPRYSTLLALSQRPSLFPLGDEPDELSIACHCTD